MGHPQVLGTSAFSVGVFAVGKAVCSPTQAKRWLEWGTVLGLVPPFANEAKDGAPVPSRASISSTRTE